MISLNECKSLIKNNISIMPIGKNKVPMGKWKRYQTELITPLEIERVYDSCEGIGIITGYENISFYSDNKYLLGTSSGYLIINVNNEIETSYQINIDGVLHAVAMDKQLEIKK